MIGIISKNNNNNRVWNWWIPLVVNNGQCKCPQKNLKAISIQNLSSRLEIDKSIIGYINNNDGNQF